MVALSSNGINTKGPHSGPLGWFGRPAPKRRVSTLGDVHHLAVHRAFGGKADRAVGHGKNGVVFAHAHAHAGVELGAALAHDDRTGADNLAAIHLHAEHFRFGVATVAG